MPHYFNNDGELYRMSTTYICDECGREIDEAEVHQDKWTFCPECWQKAQGEEEETTAEWAEGINVPPDSQEPFNLDMLSDDCIALSDILPRDCEKDGLIGVAWMLRNIAGRYRQLLDALYADGYGPAIPPQDEEQPAPPPPARATHPENAGRLIIPHHTGQVHRLDASGARTLCGKTIFPYDYKVVEEASPGDWCAGCFLAERAAKGRR